jgi:4-hydroxybenzoate polyprenyltransferase
MSMWKHLRPANLLLMALFLLGLRYFLIAPVFNSFEFSLVLGHFDFLLLVLSCMLVAGGGYLINDYYDQATDAINKPHKQLQQPERAVSWSLLCSAAGIALGVYVGFKATLTNLAIVQIVVTFLLWKYAESWKGIALLGHLVVSLVMAVLSFVPFLYEFVAISVLYRFEMAAAKSLMYVGLAYALFAYLSTFIRELIKAMQDLPGDEQAGYRTLPVKYGLAFSKKLTTILLMILLLSLLALTIFQWIQGSLFNACYLVLFVCMPIMVTGWRLRNAQLPVDFGKAATWLKITMLAGVCTLGAFYLELML